MSVLRVQLKSIGTILTGEDKTLRVQDMGKGRILIGEGKVLIV